MTVRKIHERNKTTVTSAKGRCLLSEDGAVTPSGCPSRGPWVAWRPLRATATRPRPPRGRSPRTRGQSGKDVPARRLRDSPCPRRAGRATSPLFTQGHSTRLKAPQQKRSPPETPFPRPGLISLNVFQNHNLVPGLSCVTFTGTVRTPPPTARPVRAGG